MRFLVFFLTTSLYAMPTPEVVIQKLDNMNSYSANFTQVVKADGRVISRSSGKMALKKPGRFMWDTQKPMKQLMVADGEHLWIYEPELEQVTVRKEKASFKGSAALFLSGNSEKVLKDFNLNRIDAGLYELKAKSKEASFKKIRLYFTGDILASIELYDLLGQETQIALKDAKLNTKLSEQIFRFTPPPGVDVIRQ